MRKAVAVVPNGYGPFDAPRVETSGYWVPPLAAGLAVRDDTVVIVVLKHRSFEPAYIRELPHANHLDSVDAAFAEAVHWIADFNLLLCCAVEPWLEIPSYDPIDPKTPWLWVRYPHIVTGDVLSKNDSLVASSDKAHYRALALATQMQEDFNLLQEFDREFRQLRTLEAAMERMRKILMTRLPVDMQRVTRIHHDLSF